MRSLTFICDAGQPNNNVGGWYGIAYCSYLCLDTGEMTRVEDLGQISINRAEFHAYTHILWSLTKKLEKTDDMIVNIYTDSECGVSWSRKLKEKESKGAAKRQKNKALMENWLLASQDRRVYRQLVEKFAAVSINWISRDKIVPVLGH